MGSVIDVIKLSSLILGLIVDKDDDEDKERSWKVKKIPEWKDLAKKLMDIPMNPEVKANTHKNKIRSDWYGHYGEMPKDRWVDRLHADVMMALKGDLAVAGLGRKKK